MADNESTTLNNEADSSAASNGQKQDGQQAESSTATKGAAKEPTSLDEVSAAFTADIASAETTEEQPGDELPPDDQEKAEGAEDAKADEAKGDEAEGDASEKVEEGETEKADEADPSLTDPTKPPPFHEHPRWKEVVAERDQFKPLAERHVALQTYMEQNQITGDDLRGMLEIGALMQSNPQEALRRLKPIVDGLGQLTGEALPTDLEQQVADGKITPAVAKELAKARANEQLLRSQRQQDAQRQAQQQQQYLTAALNEWVVNKQRTDLGFKQGSPLWKFVNDSFTAAQAQTPPRNPQEAVQLAERVYLEVKKLLTPAKPAVTGAKRVQTGKQVLASNGSSRVGKTKEPTNLDEVAMQATGLRWSVPRKGF